MMQDIPGYEGLYAATTDGQIWSHIRKKYLKPSETYNGYLQVILTKDGEKKNHRVHRIIAQTFIPNPSNLSDVNHLDENKKNNDVNNLEWTSRKANINYGSHNARISKTMLGGKDIPILCVELNTVYDSQYEAAKQLGLRSQCISSVLNGKQQTTGGYHFKYYVEN